MLIPLLDLAIGADPTNPPDDIVAWLEQDRYYRWVTYAFLPLQYLAIFVGFWLLADHGGLSIVDKLGLTFTLGTLNGVAINTAHELGHKKEHLERWLSQDRARPDVLRALLHRAQPRSPRAGCDTRRSGVVATG